LAALLRQLQAQARRQPVLMIFEDLHRIWPFMVPKSRSNLGSMGGRT
jgi:hypothetical protein